MTVQEQLVPTKKKSKQKQPDQLAFDLGNVFSPTAANHTMEDLDQEYSLYKARKGQAGSRLMGSGPGAGSNIPPI